MAIVIAIYTPLKWVLLNTVVVFTVSIRDCNSDSIMLIDKFQMGATPKFSDCDLYRVNRDH